MTYQVGQGGTAALDAIYQDGAGAAYNPPDPLVDIIDVLGAVRVNDATPTMSSVGRYNYAYVVPVGAPLGLWQARWSGTINGTPVQMIDYFEVVAAGSIGFPSGGLGTCTPWATEADLCSPCDDYANVGILAGDMIQAASDVLFELSGRQFPGVCEGTIRPLARCRHFERNASLPTPRRSGVGGCGCPGYLFALPDFPVVAVSQVKVDGVVVSPSLYRVDDNRVLVRLADADGSNPGWPTGQRLDLPTSAEGTWSISYTWGREPPPMGVTAAAVLACELALACDPETISKCRLPKNVTSVTREGVSLVLSPSDFLDKDGKTGLYEVDLFIRAVNPERIRRRASVWHAGMARSVRPGT